MATLGREATLVAGAQLICAWTNLGVKLLKEALLLIAIFAH